MAGPLDGVRVLDLSRVLAGPHCGRMLADLGADVIKVEPPEGDITRFMRPRVGSMATYFVQQNVGKRNLSIDLRRPEAVELALRLVEHADVVLENFRPGVMDRLGLGYERIAERNPRVIYATVTGYGPDGAWAGRAAYAATIHAEMGLLDIQSRIRGAPPEHDGFSHADVYASLECASGILAALYHRERTGEGQRVDVSMAQTMLCVNEHTHSEAAGRPDGPTSSALTRSPVLPTGEGHAITIAGDLTARGAFESLCRAIGREDLASDARFSSDDERLRNREALLDVVREWLQQFDDLEQIDAALEKGRLAMGVVRSVREAASSPWAIETHAIVDVSDRSGGTVPVASPPWRFSRTPAAVRGEPAWRGEHNREVLRRLLGMTDEQIDALERAQVLSARVPSR